MEKILNKIIRYSVVLFVFLVPWQARIILSRGEINGGYWEYGTQSLYATEIILFVALAALLARGIMFTVKNKPRLSVRKAASLPGVLLLLILFSGVSVFFSYNREVWLEHWLVLIEASAVFLIILSGAVRPRHLALAVVFSGLLQAIFAISQFFLQWVPGSAILGMAGQDARDLGVSVVETPLRRWLRAYGSFPHPNILGGWLVMSLVFLIYDLRRASQSVFDVLRYPALVVLLFGLLAAFSRSAWLGFSIFLMLFLVMMFVRKAFVQGIKIILISGAVVSVFCVAFWPPVATRFSGEQRLEIKSKLQRTSSLNESWEIIKSHPIFGVGIGNYGLAVHEDLDSSQQSWYYQPVHNVPMLILAELGIIGLILIILIAVLLFVRFAGRGESRVKGYTLLMQCLFILPIIVISLFDHYFWSLYPGMMMSSVFVGIVFSVGRFRKRLLFDS